MICVCVLCVCMCACVCVYVCVCVCRYLPPPPYTQHKHNTSIIESFSPELRAHISSRIQYWKYYATGVHFVASIHNRRVLGTLSLLLYNAYSAHSSCPLITPRIQHCIQQWTHMHTHKKTKAHSNSYHCVIICVLYQCVEYPNNFFCTLILVSTYFPCSVVYVYTAYHTAHTAQCTHSAHAVYLYNK